MLNIVWEYLICTPIALTTILMPSRIKNSDTFLEECPQSFFLTQNKELVRKLMIDFAKYHIQRVELKAMVVATEVLEPYIQTEPQKAFYIEDKCITLDRKSIIDYMDVIV